MNTLDENFRQAMDNAASVSERLNTLQILHENRIYTVLFMSPIFPKITDFRKLIEATRSFTDEYWFENLNLRGDYKTAILSYIRTNYPQYDEVYQAIYKKGDFTFWNDLEQEITAYCAEHSIKYINAFDHTRLVKEKKQSGKLMRESNFDKPNEGAKC